MRLTPWLRGARTPQNESKVPFQAILPLALKSKVSGKSDKISDGLCLQEMAILFICLKDHEYNEQLCSKEVKNFQTCYNMSLEKRHLRKQMEAKGSVGATATTASSLTINRVMKRFPPKSS